VSGPAPCDRVAAEPAWTRWLPALLVPAAVLPDLAAALPLRTYFFRDFTVTFLPLRLFAAQELRAGRFPFWNPYLFEGTFQLPSLYPPDLLHALWPGPVFVSWLLTLHLPLAALAAYWLCRELGGSRPGAFLAGLVFALGGFALSCLNLYVFLQALALAPLVVGCLRRTSRPGGGPLALAALVVALAIATLAVEFVAQAVLAGLLLALAGEGRRGLLRAMAAVALGAALAGVPVAVTLGLVPETPRGVGLGADVALANAMHPAALLQALMPHLFGYASAPAQAWWGGRFFSKGLPYFLSLYLGPLVLALAVLGLRALERRTRLVLVGLSLLGLWYALGERGGLAAVVQRLPFAAAFRFPAKALLLAHLAASVAAGRGLDRLAANTRRLLPRLAALVSLAAVGAVALAGMLATAAPGLVSWAGVPPSGWPAVVRAASLDGLGSVLLALVLVLTAVLVRRRRVGAGAAVAVVTVLVALDLARAGAGLNRQVPAAFFAPLPELADVRDPAGGRVFSYGVEHSPAFARLLASGAADPTLAGMFVDRQVLGPYTNMLDGLEAVEAKDLTAFAPRPAELGEELYDPARIGALVPWLRNAAVSRVLSLDPLVDGALRPLAEAAAGPAGTCVRAYALDGSWPRAYVACRVVREPAAAGLLRPYAPGFDAGQDVSLEEAAAAACRSGRVLTAAVRAGHERFVVETDGPGWLVVRASFARGWRARVDGRDEAVRRANGKHRAVAIPGGRHEVVFSYDPPGLCAGLLATVVGLLACVALVIGRGRETAA